METMDNLRVLVTKEGDQYVAESLEVDIFTQADNVNDLMARFILTLLTEMTLMTSEDRPIRRAPDHVFDRWNKADESLDELLTGADTIKSFAGQLGTSIELRMMA